jgi:hypothetical protein
MSVAAIRKGQAQANGAVVQHLAEQGFYLLNRQEDVDPARTAGRTKPAQAQLLHEF